MNSSSFHRARRSKVSGKRFLTFFIMYKDIPGYEGLYQIDYAGNVISIFYGIRTFLKPWTDKDGYLLVGLSKDMKMKKFRLHRLVAIVWIDNPNNYPIVLHKDNDPGNPHGDNLLWGTYKHNNNQCHKEGRSNNHYINNHPNKKIVYQFNLRGELINSFESGANAGRKLGIHKMCISDCCTGKQKTTGGFMFSHLPFISIK